MRIKRVVFDSNVLISAHILEGSVSKKAVDFAFRHCFVLYSQESFEEFESVLFRQKFDKYLSKEIRREALDLFSKLALPVWVNSSFDLCRDPKDNKFLNLAFDGKADYLITGDEDLLSLKLFHETQISNPSQFMIESESWALK